MSENSSIVKINYKTEGGQFITPCPFRKGVGVGGIDCAFWCKSFIKEDKEKQVITCNGAARGNAQTPSNQ